jgi:hypothetical protein
MAVRNPECPICHDTFQDARGLHGHLQFKHQVEGEEKKRLMEEGKSRGRKSITLAPKSERGNAQRSIRDRELELKGRLYELNRELQELTGLFGPAWADKERVEEIEQRKTEIKKRLSEI